MKERLITHKTEEHLNALTHGAGALLSCLGFYLLLAKNTGKTIFATESIIIYSLTMIILFSASTAYHLIAHPAWKQNLRVADHIGIYLLIAGTYTPVALITLVNGNGWLIFYTVWGIALAGTIMKLLFTGKYEYLSLFFYISMGWLIVFDIEDLILLTSTRGLVLLAAGGAFYTVGILFYAIRRIPYNHLIWHFFVLGGAICHWLYIYQEVL